MNKLRRVTDSTLAKWRWSKNRNENEMSLGVMGIKATIATDQDIAFSIRMAIDGNRQSKTVGHFALGVFGIEQAIEEAGKLRASWRNVAEGRESANPADTPATFLGVIDKYQKFRGDDIPKHWGETRNLIEKVYEPVMGRKPLTISRQQLQDCHGVYLDKREKETKRRPTRSVRRAFNSLKTILAYARDIRWMRPDILTGFKTGLGREPRRTRVLTPREWQLTAPALDALPKGNGVYVRFLFATAARLTMPSNMQWKDLRTIDCGTFDNPQELLTWCVPAEQMKGGYAAVFPIVGESARLIETLRSAAGGKPKPQDFVFPESPRKAWVNNPDYWQKEVFAASGTKGWHRHDLRRTMASLLKFVGADMQDVKLLLDHRERDDDDSATPCYVVIDDDNRGRLGKLAVKIEEAHALVRQIEEGRDSAELRRWYSVLQSSTKTMQGFAKAELDLDTMLKIEANPKHAKAKVVELRPAG